MGLAELSPEEIVQFLWVRFPGTLPLMVTSLLAILHRRLLLSLNLGLVLRLIFFLYFALGVVSALWFLYFALGVVSDLLHLNRRVTLYVGLSGPSVARIDQRLEPFGVLDQAVEDTHQRPHARLLSGLNDIVLEVVPPLVPRGEILIEGVEGEVFATWILGTPALVPE